MSLPRDLRLEMLLTHTREKTWERSLLAAVCICSEIGAGAKAFGCHE